jgi:hypothetical protein
MSKIIATLLWMTLIINLGISATLKEVGQKRKVEQQEHPILSRDYKVAKQALNKAVLERDEATIRLGLKANSILLKKNVFQAIRQLYYQWFVPDLIVALEENQTVGKGIETQVERQELNKSIVFALKHLTGLGFSGTENLSSDDIKRILNETREWYKKYETQIQQAMQSERLMMRQEISILSKYYYPARRAFDKAVLENDKATIRLGLKAFSLLIKRDVVQVIKQFNDKSFVPDLIDALDSNQVVMSGGTETSIEQALLSRELIIAIGELTGLKFKLPKMPASNSIEKFEPSNYVSPEFIKEVLEKSRAWRNLHKNRIAAKETR